MKRIMLTACLAVLGCLSFVTSAMAQEQSQQENPVAQLPWQTGPAVGKIGDRATIDIPKGYAFLDAAATSRLNELLENPPSGADEYTFAPDTLAWIAFFRFNDIGYVKDDEKLDADDLIASIREGTEQGNEERRDRGWETLRIVGWSFEPQYDKQLNALEWAVLAETEGSKSQVVNYNTRLLGRKGVMEVTVVADPASLDPAIADFKKQMPGYDFVAGEKYTEFKAGDHVAEIGLAALVTGGAAAIASKKGWLAAIGVALAKFWKLLILGVVGIGVAIRKFFGGRDKDSPAA